MALAAVFGAAGLAKLFDREGSKEALSDFGLPARLVGPAAIAIPLAELAVAGTLIPQSSARVGALGALVMLTAFTAAIAVNLARGRTPDCHCFGQFHSTPIGIPTLLRNGVLSAGTVLIIWQGPGPDPQSILTWTRDLSMAATLGLGAALLGFLVVSVQGWFIVQLTRQQGRLLLRIDAMEASLAEPEGLPVGAPAPDFALTSVSGEDISLRSLVARGQAVLLVFISPTCRPCHDLFPEIGRWEAQHGEAVTIALIARDDPDANRERAKRHRLSRVLIEKDREVAELYRAVPTPSGILIGADGKVGSPVAVGTDAIRALVVRMVDNQTKRRAHR